MCMPMAAHVACGGRHALGCSWGPVPCGIDPIQCSSAQTTWATPRSKSASRRRKVILVLSVPLRAPWPQSEGARMELSREHVCPPSPAACAATRAHSSRPLPRPHARPPFCPDTDRLAQAPPPDLCENDQEDVRIKLFFDGPDSNGVLKLIEVDLDGLLKAIRDHSKVRAPGAQTPRATAISSTIEPRPHSRSHPPSLPQSSPLLPSLPLRCRSLRCPR